MKKLVAIVVTLIMVFAMVMTASAAEMDSRKLDTLYSLAVTYISREDYTKAMEYLNAALEICDETETAALYADIHLKKGCVYTLQQDYENAQKELDDLHPNDVSDIRRLEMKIDECGMNDSAKAEAQKVLAQLFGDDKITEAAILLRPMPGVVCVINHRLV